MAPRQRGRSNLGQNIDRDVFQAIRKLVDERDEYDGGEGGVPSALEAYEWIKKSNSKLGRTRKKLLEESIERALDKLNDDKELDDDKSLDGDFDGLEDARDPNNNTMNMTLRSTWRVDSSKTTKEANRAAVPVPVPPTTISRKRPATAELPKKRRKIHDSTPPTHTSLADVGGVDDVIQNLSDLLVLPMTRPEIYAASRVQPPRGILLHGPPGCGKTLIANAFASELGVPFFNVSAPSIVSGMSGESEKAIREYFEEAKQAAPCLMFIDEIDAITPKRESAQREMEKRIVAQLLTCMDDLALDKTDGKCVIVLAATNRPDSLDPALRRGGRFDKEINMSVPNVEMREQILRTLMRNMNLSDSFDYETLAQMTPGFVGADLNDLVSTAGYVAIKRYLEMLRKQSAEEMDIDGCESDGDAGQISPVVKELRKLIKSAKNPKDRKDVKPISICFDDFLEALPKIQPSSQREGFTTIPDTTWERIGALESVREELQTAIVSPIKNPELYARVGITAPSGVLLWGPPGCGKTLLAKAVANESSANFISVKGPELLNKYVGESERSVRQVFVRARSSVPCVIFFDELDALVPKRDDALSESSSRVVNTLLTELDGLSDRTGIYVIGATNRPDIIDPAMLRPGRFETKIYVGLPGSNERVEILKALCRSKRHVKWTEELAEIARECEGFSGADLDSLLRRAGYAAIKRMDVIKLEDVWAARAVVRPSVGNMKKYDKLKENWARDAM